MKTSCREKVDPSPQSSLLCSLHKIKLWIDYINVIHVSLHHWKFLEATQSSEAQRRTVALLLRGKVTSPLHDALIDYSPSFLFSKKRSLNPKDVTVPGWLVLIPSQGALEHTTMSKKLSISVLRRSKNEQDQLPIIIRTWCWPTLLRQGGNTNNGWLNPKYISKAILARDRPTQIGAEITWMQVFKPGTGLSFPDASTVVPTLLAWLAPQLWSASIQHFINNIPSPVQNQQTIIGQRINPNGVLDKAGRSCWSFILFSFYWQHFLIVLSLV